MKAQHLLVVLTTLTVASMLAYFADAEGLNPPITIFETAFISKSKIASEELNPQISTFETSDHVKVKAAVYNAGTDSKKPVALLLPMAGKKRQSFDPVIAPLIAQGFAVVALDFRGQGASRKTVGNKKLSYRKFSDDDWNKLPGDVEEVIGDLQYIKGLDCKRIYIVGAALGANTAVVVGSTIGSATTTTLGQPDVAVKGLVLLSPGLNIKGMHPDAAMLSFARPVYILVGDDDGYALDSSRRLAEMAQGHATLEVLPSPIKEGSVDHKFEQNKNERKKSHGTNLLIMHPDIANKIAVWLKSQETTH